MAREAAKLAVHKGSMHSLSLEGVYLLASLAILEETVQIYVPLHVSQINLQTKAQDFASWHVLLQHMQTPSQINANMCALEIRLDKTDNVLISAHILYMQIH